MLETREEIEQWLKNMKIDNYIINDDLTVDVEGDVDLSNQGLSEIPIQFGIVTGAFNCSENKLSTLAGCPKEVGKTFLCSKNLLTTLEYSPVKIGMNFIARDNLLTSTIGISENIYWGVALQNNPLEYIDHLPIIMHGEFCFDNRKIMLKGFEDLYENYGNNDILELSLTLKKLDILNLRNRIDNKLDCVKVIKPRGKI